MLQCITNYKLLLQIFGVSCFILAYCYSPTRQLSKTINKLFTVMFYLIMLFRKLICLFVFLVCCENALNTFLVKTQIVSKFITVGIKKNYRRKFQCVNTKIYVLLVLRCLYFSCDGNKNKIQAQRNLCSFLFFRLL